MDTNICSLSNPYKTVCTLGLQLSDRRLLRKHKALGLISQHCNACTHISLSMHSKTVPNTTEMSCKPCCDECSEKTRF